MDPDKLKTLKEKLELDVNIIRFLIIKTVRENTIATKRFASRDAMRRRTVKKDEGEAPVEMNKEEVDKEIEALIAE